MKKLLVVLLLVVLIGGGVYLYMHFLHVEKPEDAFLRAVSAAMLGDEDGFLDGFTDDSRPLVAGLLALSRGKDPRRARSHPYHFLVTEDVEGVVIEGDEAWIKVRRMGTKTHKGTYDVRMVKVEGTWKIDALGFTAKPRQVDRAH